MYSVVLAPLVWASFRIRTILGKEKLQEVPMTPVQTILPLLVMGDGLLQTFGPQHLLGFQYQIKSCEKQLYTKLICWCRQCASDFTTFFLQLITTSLQFPLSIQIQHCNDCLIILRPSLMTNPTSNEMPNSRTIPDHLPPTPSITPSTSTLPTQIPTAYHPTHNLTTTTSPTLNSTSSSVLIPTLSLPQPYPTLNPSSSSMTRYVFGLAITLWVSIVYNWRRGDVNSQKTLSQTSSGIKIQCLEFVSIWSMNCLNILITRTTFITSSSTLFLHHCNKFVISWLGSDQKMSSSHSVDCIVFLFQI